MGNFIVSALKVINCSDCAKYVRNACKVHSNCSDCCSIDIETTEVEVVKDDDSNVSVDVEGCCSVHKS